MRYFLNRLDERLTVFQNLSNYLSSMSDNDIHEFVLGSTLVHQGLGGESFHAQVDSHHVFIKSVPLTGIENQPENKRNTANIFNLPLFYQYGVGSTGFGAWRELAAFEQTTTWVKNRKCANFPLLFHWRVLPIISKKFVSFPDEQAIKKDVKYWENSEAIKLRLEAICDSIHRLLLFCEYFPMTLEQWLKQQVQSDEPKAAKIIDRIDQSLKSINHFMKNQGMVHFDGHFRNIMTDEKDIFFADFGLAMSTQFDLSQEEVSFLNQHMDYDRAMSAIGLLYCVLTTVFDNHSWTKQLRKFLNGGKESLPAFIRTIATKYGEITLVMSDFFDSLQHKSKKVVFPGHHVSKLLKEID